MTRYKLIIAYDGTDYTGWQRQPGKITIAQTLEDTFKRIFGKKINIKGASRTDAGVHALGQTALFESDIAIDCKTMCWAWNRALPSDIIIRKLYKADDSFHPFYNVEYKTYYYHFFLDRPLPFAQRYGWHYYSGIDIDQLNKALQVFVGTHNFRSFCSGEPIGDNPMCTVHSISVEYLKRFGAYRIVITGKRFLRHMVRRMVGAALTAATIGSDASIEDVKKHLAAQDPFYCLHNAPAKGLLLYGIKYSNSQLSEGTNANS